MGHKLCFYEEIWLIISELYPLPLLIFLSETLPACARCLFECTEALLAEIVVLATLMK